MSESIGFLGPIWFLIWSILWAVYFMLDGFDLGAGILSPFLAKTEIDKKLLYRSLGPFWDANEVWLVMAGGVTFAAFPRAYAIIFSSLYVPLLLVLFGLIIRNIAIEFRFKAQTKWWGIVWDTNLFLGSFLSAFFLGLTFANIFRGVPIDELGINRGELSDLFNAYALLTGFIFVFVFSLHGALWLKIKTSAELETSVTLVIHRLWRISLIGTVVFLFATKRATYLFDNYIDQPALFIIPSIFLLLFILVRIFAFMSMWRAAWASSLGTIFFFTLFCTSGLYPNLLKSSLYKDAHLTIFNSASSPLTLKIMLGVAMVVVPLVSIYQVFGYKIFKDRLEEKDLLADDMY